MPRRKHDSYIGGKGEPDPHMTTMGDTMTRAGAGTLGKGPKEAIEKDTKAQSEHFARTVQHGVAGEKAIDERIAADKAARKQPR